MNKLPKHIKKYAWDAFSLYMRTKLCLEQTGGEYGNCYTCNAYLHIKEFQAGHFIDGRTNAVLFAEDLIRLQCYGCNVGKKGNKVNYTLNMQKELGIDGVNELIAKYKNITIQYKKQDYFNIREQYKIKLKELTA